MQNVSKFIKEHIPLCICTIGLAIIGYLGFHAIKWIIIKCAQTQKIDEIGQKTINSSSYFSSPPP
jgi:hypothetical protein